MFYLILTSVLYAKWLFVMISFVLLYFSIFRIGFAFLKRSTGFMQRRAAGVSVIFAFVAYWLSFDINVVGNASDGWKLVGAPPSEFTLGALILGFVLVWVRRHFFAAPKKKGPQIAELS